MVQAAGHAKTFQRDPDNPTTVVIKEGTANERENYEALQASASANKTTTVEEKVREVKNISRSEYYSFTATGVFRP